MHGVHAEIVKFWDASLPLQLRAERAGAPIEAAFICGVMASELGLNLKLARRAAPLHDIGKSLTHEVEGCTP